MKQFLSYKTIIVLTGAIWLLACGVSIPERQARAEPPAGPRGTAGRQQAPAFVPDEVLVGFKQPSDQTGLEALILQFKLKMLRRFATPGLFLVRITDGTPVPIMVRRLKAQPAIRYAEPNYIVSAQGAVSP